MLEHMAAPTQVTFRYGPAPSQFGEFTLPAGDGPVPGIVVLVHGGFWRAAYGLELMRPLAEDLVARGWATWNIEYRRVGATAATAWGTDEGGWTATFEDVAAAVDLLADIVTESFPGRLGDGSVTGGIAPGAFAGQMVDLPDPLGLPVEDDVPAEDLVRPVLAVDRIVAVGHSAGGQLATWLAARPGLPAGAPGADPTVTVRGVVSLAGVLDLVAGAAADLGDGAVVGLMEGPPEEFPERYEIGSPTARAPLGVPVVCVHGTADLHVPLEQSELFVAADQGQAQLIVLDDEDHGGVVDPTTDSWKTARDALEALLA